MSRAVLVMDMPENCFDCRLWHIGDEYPEDFCGVDEKNISSLFERPDWCPLIELPDRINVSPENTEVYVNIYADGWNACIDALEGKENE